MRQFGWDFITFVSMRMQCSNWSQILNVSSEYIQTEFKGRAFYSQKSFGSRAIVYNCWVLMILVIVQFNLW